MRRMVFREIDGLESKKNHLTNYYQVEPKLTLGDMCEPQIQYKIPQTDWEDYAFPEGLIQFCLPDGWYIQDKFHRPQFFSNVLTNIDGYQSFCSCLLFYENYNKTIFVPKALIIVSKFNFYQQIKEILVSIFNVMCVNNTKTTNTEAIIAKIIFNKFNANPSSPKFTLSIGNNRFVICPPISMTIPVTDDFVAVLLQNVGIYNLMRLFGALLLDSKIVFISKSYTYLYKCCLGLVSLIYPFKYYYTFIPVLPNKLTDALHAPTPFMIGVHSSCTIDMSEFTDVLFMNIDIGQLTVHDSFELPFFPEPFSTEIINHLLKITRPDLDCLDEVFPLSIKQNIRLTDKKIRACFFFLILKILAGYRPCITFVRLLPFPVMKFHLSLFLQNRNISKTDFYIKFFETTSFNTFINERGLTYRACDFFDDIINLFEYDDNQSSETQIKIIQQIWQEFLRNEPSCDPNNFSCVDLDNIQPTDSQLENVEARDIDVNLIVPSRNYKPLPQVPSQNAKSNVPLNNLLFQHNMVYYIGYRRKEMIKECIDLIFLNKIAEARKLRTPMLQSMSSKACRIEFINRLLKHMSKDRTILLTNQITLISGLLDHALDHDTTVTCFSVASLILPICFNFCHLVGEAYQFMCVLVQNHPVWQDLNFWINYYFYETQISLLTLYNKSVPSVSGSPSNSSRIELSDSVTHPQLPNVLQAIDSSSHLAQYFETADEEQLKTFENTEISFLHSQTVDILYKICHMLIKCESLKVFTSDLSRKGSASVDNFENIKRDKIKEISTFMNNFVNFVNRFVYFSQERLTMLAELINNIIEARIDEIISMLQEMKKIENQQDKLKFRPIMLYNLEKELYNVYGCMFYTDDQEYLDYDPLGSISLLPAKGFLFLTNFRVVFVGHSVDDFLSDFAVNISIPIALVIKLKSIDKGKIKIKGFKNLTKSILIKTKLGFVIQFSPSIVSFDSCCEQMRKLLKNSAGELIKRHGKLGRPKTELPSGTLHKSMRSNAVRCESLSSSLSQSVIPGSNSTSNLTVGKSKKTGWFKKVENFANLKKRSTIKELIKNEKLSDIFVDRELISSYVLGSDYIRMGFFAKEGSTDLAWRMTPINRNHVITPNIPEYFIVPSLITDDSLSALFKIFRQRRIPVGTYFYGLNSSSTENQSNKIFSILRSEIPSKNAAATSQKIAFSNKAGNEVLNFLANISNSVEVIRNKYNSHISLDKIILRIDPKQEFDISSWKIQPFCVFYDRIYVKNTNLDRANFVTVDNFTSQGIKKAFDDFIKSFYPPLQRDKPKVSILNVMNDSKWFQMIARAFKYASCACFLADVNATSSLFSLSYGPDLTSILCSLVQILIDPFYRTMNGFQKLLEKDWFEFNYNFFGKNFVHFLPIFLFFLDCVYQLTKQFPHSFEFNTYYLNFIAFHNFSFKFDNFTIGDENVDIPLDDPAGNTPQSVDEPNFDKISISPSCATSVTEGADYFIDSHPPINCIFRFIQSYNENSIVFYNLLYDPIPNDILYPRLFTSSYQIWPLYYLQDFQLLCMYNLETVPNDSILIFQSILGPMKRDETNDEALLQNRIIDDVKTFSYTGEGTPYVLSSIGEQLYKIFQFLDELDLPKKSCHLYLNSDTPCGKLHHITSSFMIEEFSFFRSIFYRLTSVKHNKIESDKTDNLHAIVKIDSFFPAYCTVCSRPVVLSFDSYYCLKCRKAVHHHCQQYFDSLCTKSLDNRASGAESVSSFLVEPTSELDLTFVDNEVSVAGILFTKKVLSSTWNPKFCYFNKKSMVFSIYETRDLSSMPMHIYEISQLSGCKEVKLAPCVIYKEHRVNPGSFEIKIKKKLEIFATITKEETEKWVKLFNRYLEN